MIKTKVEYRYDSRGTEVYMFVTMGNEFVRAWRKGKDCLYDVTETGNGDAARVFLEETGIDKAFFDSFGPGAKFRNRHLKALIDAAATASQFAKEVHNGQVDKGGNNYYTSHLCKVAEKTSSPKEEIVAWLHDVAEDTPHTESQAVMYLKEKNRHLSLEDMTEIQEALTLLNSRRCATREEYIEAIKGNPLARAVKIYDLRNNMDITRIPHPTEKDYERAERYKAELKYLMEKTQED